MSKQLSLSAAFSVLAMAAFVLSSTPDHMPTGAQAYAHAPAELQIASDLPLIAN
jgi:hypothetical protein